MKKNTESIILITLIPFLSLSLILFSVNTWAVGAFKPTEAELRMLPPYCKPKAVNLNSKVGPYQKYRPLIKIWKQRLGPDYVHLHHYCQALQALNKIYKEPEKKKFYYKVALGNIEYMERNASKKFILMPEIFYTKAKVLYSMGRTDDAIKYLISAIRLKKNFTAPYVKLIEIYSKLGMKDKAKKVLTTGLKYNPKSKALLRRKDELLR